MHYAGLLGHKLEHTYALGWNVDRQWMRKQEQQRVLRSFLDWFFFALLFFSPPSCFVLFWFVFLVRPAHNRKHDWKTLVHNVGDYIKGLNSSYKKALMDSRVEYLNAYARFVDAHTVEYTDAKGVTKTTTADKFIIAVGGRPK